jgi:hypothetical protein
MKLTTQRLKKLIREEIELLKESEEPEKIAMTPEYLEKLLKIASGGLEGYKHALELALQFKDVDYDKIEAAAAPDFKTREYMFTLPYGKRPKAAIEYEIEKTIEDIKNAKTPREKHILEDLLDSLEEELLEY